MSIEDGRLGQETLRALEICLKADGAGYLLNVMRILQALHYIGRIKQNPEQDSFARGTTWEFGGDKAQSTV
jgi:hypothetical protein